MAQNVLSFPNISFPAPANTKERTYLQRVLGVRDHVTRLQRCGHGRLFRGTDIPATVLDLVTNRPDTWTIQDVYNTTAVGVGNYYRWLGMRQEGILFNGMTVRYL